MGVRGQETDKIRAREKRHARVRARVSGDASRPRLCIFRSLNHIYAQAIDDALGVTLASASTLELRGQGAKTGNLAAAKKVGELIAGRLKEKGLEQIVFDRGGYLYHGRVQAVADGARAAGLKF
jgi:large subunit ribosomal protein L18